MAILGRQKKKGTYSEYKSNRGDSRRQHFFGEESSLRNDQSIPELNINENSTADGIDYYIPEVGNNPLDHLRIDSLQKEGRSSVVNKDTKRLSTKDQDSTIQAHIDFGTYEGNESSPNINVMAKGHQHLR